jgi:hypothetical protein
MPLGTACSKRELPLSNLGTTEFNILTGTGVNLQECFENEVLSVVNYETHHLNL